MWYCTMLLKFHLVAMQELHGDAVVPHPMEESVIDLLRDYPSASWKSCSTCKVHVLHEKKSSDGPLPLRREKVCPCSAVLRQCPLESGSSGLSLPIGADRPQWVSGSVPCTLLGNASGEEERGWIQSLQHLLCQLPWVRLTLLCRLIDFLHHVYVNTRADMSSDTLNELACNMIPYIFCLDLGNSRNRGGKTAAGLARFASVAHLSEKGAGFGGSSTRLLAGGEASRESGSGQAGGGGSSSQSGGAGAGKETGVGKEATAGKDLGTPAGGTASQGDLLSSLSDTERVFEAAVTLVKMMVFNRSRVFRSRVTLGSQISGKKSTLLETRHKQFLHSLLKSPCVFMKVADLSTQGGPGFVAESMVALLEVRGVNGALLFLRGAIQEDITNSKDSEEPFPSPLLLQIMTCFMRAVATPYLHCLLAPLLQSFRKIVEHLETDVLTLELNIERLQKRKDEKSSSSSSLNVSSANPSSANSSSTTAFSSQITGAGRTLSPRNAEVGKDAGDYKLMLLEKNQMEILSFLSCFFERLVAYLPVMPPAARTLLAILRQEIEGAGQELQDRMNSISQKLPPGVMGVTSFFIFHIICPAIVNPHNYIPRSLLPFMVTADAQPLLQELEECHKEALSSTSFSDHFKNLKQVHPTDRLFLEKACAFDTYCPTLLRSTHSRSVWTCSPTTRRGLITMSKLIQYLATGATCRGKLQFAQDYVSSNTGRISTLMENLSDSSCIDANRCPPTPCTPHSPTSSIPDTVTARMSSSPPAISRAASSPISDGGREALSSSEAESPPRREGWKRRNTKTEAEQKSLAGSSRGISSVPLGMPSCRGVEVEYSFHDGDDEVDEIGDIVLSVEDATLFSGASAQDIILSALAYDATERLRRNVLEIVQEGNVHGGLEEVVAAAKAATEAYEVRVCCW